jgi:hypothetical protein
MFFNLSSLLGDGEGNNRVIIIEDKIAERKKKKR